MKLEFKDIAFISGKKGLFKILQPTKSGVLLEALDKKRTRLVATAYNEISVLEKMSVFTHSSTGMIPLKEVFYAIHEKFTGDIGLDKNSDPKELKKFFHHILENYNEKKVYVSDIKKIVTWYNILIKETPKLLKNPIQKKEKPLKKEK